MELQLSQEEQKQLRYDVVKEIKKEQYREIVKAKNTYKIFFNSINADNFAGCDQSQNGMKFTIPSNNTGHIQYCKYRITNISLPPSTTVMNLNALHLRVGGGLVMNSGLPIKDIARTDNLNGGIYPTTVSGVTKFADAGDSRSVVNRNQVGGYCFLKNRRATRPTTKFYAVKPDGTLESIINNTAPAGPVINAVGGVVAFTNSGIHSAGSETFNYGFNPFGKTLDFTFLSDIEEQFNIVDETNTNNGRTANFSLTFEMEIELLPDFNRNDNISN